MGSTRSSLSAERRRTDGYFVPAFTWWYGEYAFALSETTALEAPTLKAPETPKH